MKARTFLSGLLLMTMHTSHLFAEDDTRLHELVPADAKVEKLAGGMKFTEGPVWISDAIAPGGGFVVLSDQPNDALMRWNDKDGLTEHRKPAEHPNGHTLDADKNVIGCQQRPRRVVRFDPKMQKFETLVDRCDGKRFSSPNDVVVKSDGTIWFTDPTYGLPKGEAKETDGNYVYRFDPKTKDCRAVAKEFDMPNGLCFSPDEKTLYIADSGKPKNIRAFDVQPDGALGEGKLFCTIDKGVPDGIRCDEKGNVWSSAGDGIQIFAPDGKLIGRIVVPESPANLCFGGTDGKTVFITARTSLYAIKANVTGAQRP
jgi:gluconolactonase